MKRHALHVLTALATFALGVSCAAVLKGHEPFRLGCLGEFVPGLVILAGAAACFGQSFRCGGGLRRNTSYNMLMLSLSGLLFFTAGFLLLLASSAQVFMPCTR